MIAQMAVNGLLTGMIYVIMALGFTLIFGIMRIVNFAHGEFYMVGAVAVILFFQILGWPFFLAVLAGGLFAALIGVIVERGLFRRLEGDEMAGMIMSLSLAILLQSGALWLLGPGEKTVQRAFTGTWSLFGASVPIDRTAVALAALVILAGFTVILKYTRIGLAMQAVAQDPETAGLMGVEAGQIYSSAFGLGCLLAGFAGALMAPIFTIGPYMGEVPMLKAFVVVILGGLGSIPGAVLGGLLLGMTESFLATWFNTATAMIASFTVVLLVVLLRPNGLMGRGVRS